MQRWNIQSREFTKIPKKEEIIIASSVTNSKWQKFFFFYKKLQTKRNQQKHKAIRYIEMSKIVKKHQCFTGNLSKTAFLRFLEVKSKRYIQLMLKKWTFIKALAMWQELLILIEHRINESFYRSLPYDKYHEICRYLATWKRIYKNHDIKKRAEESIKRS